MAHQQQIELSPATSLAFEPERRAAQTNRRQELG